MLPGESIGAIGRDDHDGRQLRQGQRLERVDRIHPVHPRHLPVEQQQVVRAGCSGRGSHGGHGFRPGGDQIGLDPPAGEEFRQQLPGRGIVIDQEHAEAAQPLTGDQWRVLRQTECDGGDERAAAAGLALHRDAAAHGFHDLAADGEAKSCPAETAGGGTVGLREG